MSKDLNIFRAVSTNYLTQDFGENKSPIYKEMGMKGHGGKDYLTWFKEPTYHCADFEGWLYLEEDSAGGLGANVVSYEPILKCTEPNCDEMHYVKARYWHNEVLVGYEGKRIKMGDLVALSGTTGMSNGVHLHKGFKFCNSDGTPAHPNNGYFGAFDFTPYYENKFVLDVTKTSYTRNPLDFLKILLSLIKIAVLKLKK
jgi:hypothetical protein